MPGRTSAGKRYAEAVAGIARQDNSWEQWRRDLGAIGQVLGNPELRLTLESPRILPERKQRLLNESFGGRIAPATLNLLNVMAQRGRLGLLPDMLVWFDEIADRALGVRRYTVTTAAPLTDEQRAQLQQRLGGAAGGQVILTEQVDPSIMGGMVLRHEDVIADYSVRSRLEALRERLN
jgi:F-type H+-transporting ATPase subunit delta